MDNFQLSAAEAALILRALDEVEDVIGNREYLIPRLRSLQFRFANGISSFTLNDLRLVCEGLELLLAREPMNYPASQLLGKLNSQILRADRS